MKKLCLSVIAVASIVSAPFTFADNNVAGGYTSSLSQQATHTASPTLTAAPASMATTAFSDTATKILVTNSSRTILNIEVPGTPIRDYQHTNTHDYIRHGSFTGRTNVVLKDPNGNVFWSQNVCNHAIIDVTGGPGTYNIDLLEYRC